MSDKAKYRLKILVIFAIFVFVVILIMKNKDKDDKQKDASKKQGAAGAGKTSGYIGSPSGIEFSGCYGRYDLNYPYKYGYGGYGNLGSGMTMPSWADTYNQEIGACWAVWENGRSRIRCMR